MRCARSIFICLFFSLFNTTTQVAACTRLFSVKSLGIVLLACFLPSILISNEPVARPLSKPELIPHHVGPGCHAIIGLWCEPDGTCDDAVFDNLCVEPNITQLMTHPAISQACQPPRELISYRERPTHFHECSSLPAREESRRCYSPAQVLEIVPHFCNNMSSPVLSPSDRRRARIDELKKQRSKR